MRKLAGLLLIAVAAVTLTGCGEPEPAAQSQALTEQTAEVDEAAKVPADSAADITAPGEVCDPHNLNDSICAAFYPEQAALNVTSAPRALEPLASLTDEEKIDLAKQACDVLAAGGSKDTDTIVDTPADNERGIADWNNGLAFTAGSLAFCQEHLSERPRAFIEHYEGIGEAAAKESFKDGVMPEL